MKSYVQLPCDEELITTVLYKHGPFFIFINAPMKFFEHIGEIFTDYYEECQKNRKRDHTASLNGLGTENGHDYGIIKNCYGTRTFQNDTRN